MSHHLTPTSLLELYVVLLRFGFFRSIPGDAQETVSRQDLTEFHTFLLKQFKSHTSELSSKFDKASTDAMCALSVTKQLNVESELKFSYPGNERNYKFNLEVLDLLESTSKAPLVQDSAKASQVPAHPPHANSCSQFLNDLSSSVSDLLHSGQGTVSTVSTPDVSLEFMTLMEDKFTHNSSLAFYKQNLYEYEQGTAPVVVKGTPTILG